ncbi:Predicted ATP-dependent endonuclease of the OLD family, contains P-loop ATPase and TOPRIM domains [Curtobacterium sp. 9128]|uniref:ATP-dependent nuclease n=1 Tax=Curtobacterium sp. 9128 TaxID=1793722 RepID=UPI0007D721F3|nr:ATP-dependent endonuclease [Curtobacterium sp. 9128]SBN61643.1 Predicted ATP-dependent endonuclease of the OLD family, contains P-loop ATPase and TOPRIM domains [Curtobacterium sp. 9128]
MHIASIRVKNFRCLEDVRVDMDALTSFVGPNGAGKSTVLRALDWFFNGETRLVDEDVYSGAVDDRRISVEVKFSDLTVSDREALGTTYAPPGSTTFTAWRIWDDGSDKMTARARSFPAFEEIRNVGSAREKKGLWNDLIARGEAPGLPAWTNLGAADQAMTLWESDNPDRLEETETGVTHLFGFNGQNKLSGLFDFVLVTADLRASEESVEGKKTIIGRILERAIDREGANTAFEALAKEVSEKQTAINEKHLGKQLDDLAEALTAEVRAFTAGRGVRLHPRTPDLRPSPASISVAISDALNETSVDRQGHGFQRALLISSLKLLAARGAQGNDGSVICLAIEEPELFQHPTQARVFSNVLRDLADDPAGGLQVMYATHSPYFIDPRFFDQVRRVTRRQHAPDEHPSVSVHVASLDAVTNRLDGFEVTDAALRSRWDQVCTKNLAEAFFADAVVLVEGDTDKGILDGIAAREGQTALEVQGVTVAYSGGKQHLFIPHAILAELSIPTLVVFDNDKGGGSRLRANGRPEKAAATEANEIATNRRLLAYLGETVVDNPEGQVSATVHVWADRLEDVIENEWGDWDSTRQSIVDSGRGAAGKNAATYALAAQECLVAPSGELIKVMDAARALVTSAP